MQVQASDLRPSGVSCSSNLVTGGNTVLIKDTGNHSDQERGAGARGHAHRGLCGGAGGGAGGAAGGPRPAETCRQRPHGVHRRSPPGPPLPQGTVDPTPATATARTLRVCGSCSPAPLGPPRGAPRRRVHGSRPHVDLTRPGVCGEGAEACSPPAVSGRLPLWPRGAALPVAGCRRGRSQREC